MFNIIVEELEQTPMEQQRVELVERKGTGHPDSMCDAIMEQVSLALCREYLTTFGRVLHYNVDKGLLVVGRTQPRLGGGSVLEPMRLVFGDRATAELGRSKARTLRLHYPKKAMTISQILLLPKLLKVWLMVSVPESGCSGSLRREAVRP